MYRRLWMVARRLVLAALGTAIGLRVAPRFYGMWMRRAESTTTTHHHTGPTLEQLLPLSNLVTLRVQISDVLETRIHGVTGGITAAILIKGEVELSTDLSQARFEAFNEEERSAVLVLSDPQVSQARLDHTKTRIFALNRDGLWMLVASDYADKSVINKAYEDAQNVVTAAADDEAMRHRARIQAEQVLGQFFSSVHWRIAIRWAAEKSPVTKA